MIKRSGFVEFQGDLMMCRSRVLALLTAVALAASASVVSAQKDEKRSKEEQKEIQQLVKLVDGVMTGETPAPTDIQLELEPFFLKSQEKRTFVPFVLSVNGAPAADSAMYVRVVNPADYEAAKDKKKYEYPWDDIHFIPAAQLPGGTAELSRVFMAEPGTYDVYIALKERLPEKAPKDQVAKAGVLKTQVTVPDFANGELSTSSVLVTNKVNQLTAPLSPEEARERPFVFGPQELVPALDMSFKKSEELSILYQVYNSGLDAAGKPDLVMEYNFHKKEGDTEKFFNKTNPTTINASNLPPTFDPTTFPVPGGITVPLTTFGEGTYRLEIKITDKAAGKTLTRDVNFTVTAS
jgi:hypothetical protein